MIDKLKEILAKEILDTKMLKSLDYDYVYSKLEKFILTYGDVFKKLRLHVEKKGLDSIEKNKYFKEIIKRVRSELNIVYASYLMDDFFKKDLDLEVEDLLHFHKSTKERVDFYDEIYSKIFNWYKPYGIADLACGLNPLSYFLIKENLNKDVKYFASDLSSKDMNFVQSFFDKNKIGGIARGYDITKLDFLEDENFKDCDLVFLFKALDSFEEVKKDISKDILERIPQKNIVISFPTKSLQSKVAFKLEKRNWLFNFLKRMSWNYETFEVENELFILVSKN